MRSNKSFVKIKHFRLEQLMTLFPGVAPRVYCDSQVLVRNLFWGRLKGLISMSKPPRHHRVLDFGGGNGVLAPTLSGMFQEGLCVDLKTEMGEELVRQERITNFRYLTGELISLCLPDGHFDTIVAADVLEHIPCLDELLNEFQRLLIPGGDLLVSSPTENRFYELGRLFFGYSKPDDHHHGAQFIDNTIHKKIPLIEQRYYPLNISALGVFSLARFVKN